MRPGRFLLEDRRALSRDRSDRFRGGRGHSQPTGCGPRGRRVRPRGVQLRLPARRGAGRRRHRGPEPPGRRRPRLRRHHPRGRNRGHGSTPGHARLGATSPGRRTRSRPRRQAGCRRFIQLSCADVTLYDGPRSFWTEADAPQRPYGALAQTKLQAEELVRVSGTKRVLDVALRPGSCGDPETGLTCPAWKQEAETGGVRIVAGGKKLMATTYIGNLGHAVVRALETKVTTGNVYYVVDTELTVSREFFTELSERLEWSPPRSAGPYRWAWFSCRTGLSPLASDAGHSPGTDQRIRHAPSQRRPWRTNPCSHASKAWRSSCTGISEPRPRRESTLRATRPGCAKPSPRRGSPNQTARSPSGSIIVHEGTIIGRGRNARETSQDPTTHAEMIAIREAANALGSWRLIDTTLYVTLEPCPMCAGALVNARVPRVVWGCNDPKAGATETLYTIGSDPRLNHRFDCVPGVLGDECSCPAYRVFRSDPCQRQPPETALTPQGVLLASAAES